MVSHVPPTKRPLMLVYSERCGTAAKLRERMINEARDRGHERRAHLVVDDDPKVRTLLRRCLEGEGFAVSEAADGQGF
jgi:PleD family two-component response regulator